MTAEPAEHHGMLLLADDDAAFRQRLQGLRPEVAWLDAINQRS